MSEELCKAYTQALIADGVPQEIAEKAAQVIANDRPGEPNLGRSPEDQQAVLDAWEASQSKEVADE
ncbi:hypothetical protein [Calothrix sp. PCC 7507]|uniref:hypothetical protein n=1 Tax=Calothrix sp. PCC 7507 TaxID=99598 RepID=UPI00029F31C7|nr:hypothetical protein [Calothrix sp. PCC 7507]AFY31621.1 hypothetical protein Cal7507_1147 [Calothrix sp. PCC 7507]